MTRIGNFMLAMVSAALCSFARAGDVHARIDVNGISSGIALEGKEISAGGESVNATWEKDEKKQNCQLISYFIAGKEWKTGTFSLTPDKSGTVTLRVLGTHSNHAAWTLITDIATTGATLTNGNFKAGLAGWTESKWTKDGSKASVTDGRTPDSKAIKVSHDCGVIQDITVIAGQEVKVTFSYKIAE